MTVQVFSKFFTPRENGEHVPPVPPSLDPPLLYFSKVMTQKDKIWKNSEFLEIYCKKHILSEVWQDQHPETFSRPLANI